MLDGIYWPASEAGSQNFYAVSEAVVMEWPELSSRRVQISGLL
jgi:hypothetical protein